MAIFASGMKTKASDILKYTIGALIAGALLWLALRNVQWKLVGEGLAHCKWGFILLMLAANLASLALRTIRWRLLVKPVAPGERRGTIFNAYCIGNMFNSLLPGSGELIRCGFIRSSEASYQKVLGTVLTERIWDAISIVVLVIIALLAGSGEFASFCHERIWMPMANGFSTKWCPGRAVQEIQGKKRLPAEGGPFLQRAMGRIPLLPQYGGKGNIPASDNRDMGALLVRNALRAVGDAGALPPAGD